MKKKLLLPLTLLLVVVSFSIAMGNTREKVMINGDTIIGYQKDIERFQEAEQFLMDWFISEGYNLSYDVHIEFTSDVDSKLPKEERGEWEYKLGGLFYNSKTYVVDYYTFMKGRQTKFNIKLGMGMVQRGIIIHELMHYYLFKCGISTVDNSAVHEYMAAIVEIESYSLKHRDRILNKAANLIKRHKYHASEFVMHASNYEKDHATFQILSYWVYKSRDGEILIDSIMSIP